jgi:hypothetical protein
MANKQGTSSPPQVLEAVSVFLCPLVPDEGVVDRLETRWRTCEPAEAATRAEDDIRLFHDPAWEEACFDFGKNGISQVVVNPRAAWVPTHPWMVLVLEAQLRPGAEKSLSFDDLLTFNVEFRRMRGEPEPQDSFFAGETPHLFLADGVPASHLYERLAHAIAGSFVPLPNLSKAVVLSYAQFDRLLNDTELYRFGSIAYPHEPITPAWVAQQADRIFDRWKDAGWRCFVYSYSLIYALDAQYQARDDTSIRQRFLRDYVKMGVAIAMQRAWLQEFPQRLRDTQDLPTLRRHHEELVRTQSRFGVRWTPEGTQRMQLEQAWRQAAGVDERLAEVTQLLEHKIDLLEANATDQLNTALLALQLLFGAFTGAQIGLDLVPKQGLPLTLLGLAGGGVFGLLICWLVAQWFGYGKVRHHA